MVRREGVQLCAGGKTPLDKLGRHPAAADYDPAAGRFGFRRRGDLLKSVGERAERFPVELGIPTQAGDGGVDMRIDQSRDDRSTTEIDDVRASSDQRAHVTIRPSKMAFGTWSTPVPEVCTQRTPAASTQRTMSSHAK